MNVSNMVSNILIRCGYITPSKLQTKDWRKAQKWYKGGKSNECELHQRRLVEVITEKPCVKTSTRINVRSMSLEDVRFPMKRPDGFDYTEDFDGRQGNVYYNLKIICDKGGAQTRSLREVYHFVEAQIKLNSQSKYFVNILDGDCSYSSMKHFNYLLDKYDQPNNIFVGDMSQFREWHQLRIE